MKKKRKKHQDKNQHAAALNKEERRMVHMLKCNVCGNTLQAPIYETAGKTSLTSLCEIYPQPTEVYCCRHCSHVQSREIEGIEAFYDVSYKILIDSEEEDQLYKIVDGRPVYRVDHQVTTLLHKLAIPHEARVLDYGCAKGATLRELVLRRPDIVPHLFDVSDMYTGFWKIFLPAEHYATYIPRPEWQAYFDLVTSFFALEHVSQPRTMLADILRLLKPGGQFYCIVPNCYSNSADLVVIDHVNHFSDESLRLLFTYAGFLDIEIDTSSHDSAFIITARRPSTENSLPVSDVNDQCVARLCQQATAMGRYWQDVSDRIRSFEKTVAGGRPAVIYGSGFYGAFIAAALTDLAPVVCFLDRNPYRQEKQLLEKPIISPDALSGDVEILYVGLNPRTARTVIEGMAQFQNRHLTFFYL